MPTITLLNRSNRSGSFTTPSYSVPAGSSGPFMLRTNMLETTITTVGKSATVTLEVSTDGGASWVAWGGFTWVGRAMDYKEWALHNAGIGGDLASLAGKMIRAQITLANATQIGFVVEIP